MNFTKDNPVYTEIKNKILAGRWARGSHLRPTDLADDLRVSVSPVREALIRLSARGLVENAEKIGFKIATYDLETSNCYCDMLYYIYQASLRKIRDAGLWNHAVQTYIKGLKFIEILDISVVSMNIKIIDLNRGAFIAEPFFSLAQTMGDIITSQTASATLGTESCTTLSEAWSFAECLAGGCSEKIDVILKRHFDKKLEIIRQLEHQSLTGQPPFNSGYDRH